ncbi:MAG: DUF4365 domain-containing protein [Desulfobulbus sp.]|nr:DUF4365 domain-containing protein [Desulfobulbus sp.]
MNNKKKTDRLGVAKLDLFFSNFGWLFREQPIHDYGIDAQVEIVVNNQPTGDLIAIQVKSGKSYFTETTDTDIIYRADNNHIDYWTAHCLPVIIVLYDPENDRLYWEHVSEKTYVSAGKSWKIAIPKNKILDNESLANLSSITQPPPYIQNLNRLRLDKKWIDLLADGESVYVEFEDWVNKSLSRHTVTIGCACESIKEQWPTIYGNSGSIEGFISHLFPWADYETDEDAHREYMESVWADECYGGYDREDDIVIYTESFDDWYQKPTEKIVQVSDEGEVVGYRLLLSLNVIGKAFLTLNEFLEEKDRMSARFITLGF